MFWNKKCCLSVRWKTAITFAVTFLITMVACFTALFVIQYRFFQKNLERRLNDTCRILEVAYLRGTVLNAAEVITLPEKFEKQSADYVAKNYPDFRIKYIIRNLNRQVLEVLGTQGKDKHPCMIDVGTERDNPKAIFPLKETNGGDIGLLKQEFDENFCNERSRPFYFLLVSPDGKVLTRSVFPDRYVERFIHTENMDSEKDDEKEQISGVRIHDDSILINKRVLYDGNILIAGIKNENSSKALSQLLTFFLISIAIVPLLGAIVGFLVGNSIAGNLKRLTKSARAIERGLYSERVPHPDSGTELDELADAFNDMASNTEKVLFELKNISDNVAHDLRTPLTRLNAKAELAILEDPHNSLASDVAEECSNLLEMINTSLELSRTESGSVPLDASELDVAELAKNMTELYMPSAEDLGIKLQCRTPEQPGMAIVNANRTRMQRLLANLLDNALKFTSANGSVTVTVTNSRKFAILKVSDSGCGIAQNDLSNIFKRFYRADSSRSRTGNGLGLCLVKAIAEMYGGSVSVESTLGRGTTFTVEIPKKS